MEGQCSGFKVQGFKVQIPPLKWAGDVNNSRCKVETGRAPSVQNSRFKVETGHAPSVQNK